MGPDGHIYFTEARANKILRIDPLNFAMTELAIPQPNTGPGGIVTAADGLLWIMETSVSSIVRMNTAGTFFPPFPAPIGSFPHGPSLGRDGNVWFAEMRRNRVARITPSGVLTEWLLPQAASQPDVTISAADGVYFTEFGSNKIGRIGLNFAITQWAIPTASSGTVGIIVGVNGNLYFTEKLADKVGILPLGGGIILEFPLLNIPSHPDKITRGADGALWFTELAGSRIGRFN